MDWISCQLFECYEEHINDAEYLKDLKKRFEEENKNKYESLFSLFNADARIRKSFAKRLNVEYEDLKVFMNVLQRT